MAPASLLNSKPYFKFKNTYPQDIESKFEFKKWKTRKTIWLVDKYYLIHIKNMDNFVVIHTIDQGLNKI